MSTRVAAEVGTLAVDWTRCDGHGLCKVLLPDRIELDEWGFPVLRNPSVAADDEPDVRHAVAACPALALYLAPGSRR
jgi:ferredoxin